MITLSFEDKQLHDTCTALDRAESEFGRIEAEALITLISDMVSIDDAGQLFSLYDRILVGGGDSLRVPIGASCQATLVPTGTRFERAEDGCVIWETVTRLKLVEVSRMT